MTRTLVAMILTLSVAAPALAQDATGGPSGAPNQAQAVVPSGTTGGRAGAPSQSQYVKKSHHTKKKHH